MAVVMESGSSWRKAHEAGRDFLLQSSNSSNKSDDSSKPSTSSTSGASTVIALGGGGCGQSAVQSKKRGWGDGLQKTLQLMLGQAAVLPERETLDFLGVSNDSQQQGEFLELDPNLPLPVGWEKCLDLRTGAVYFLNRASGEKSLGDPRHLVPGVGLGLGLGALLPATPSFYDAEADRNSDSPGTPPRSSAARNFFSGGNSSSPSPRREGGAIQSSSGLFLGSSAEPAAPMPWALEHWAAAAKGFSERNPLPAATPAAPASDMRFTWLPGQHGVGTAATTAAVEGLNCAAAGEESVVEDDGMGSNLELKLSSSSSGASAGVPVRDQGRSVCTMEKVREALLRSDRMLGKMVAQPPVMAHNQSWSRSCCQPLFNLRSPASPSHSSSSASSSTPPSVHELGGGEARASISPPKRFRSCSPKSATFPQPQQHMLASSSCYRVSSPNCVSSSSNVSSPAHPCSGSSPASTCCTTVHPGGLSSFLSPNLASLKLASPSLSELERGSPSQVLTLGGGGAGQLHADSGSSVALACCKSCLMYMLLSKEDPRCPRCRNCVDVAFAPSAPCSSSLLPPLKKAKLEVDL